jgi:hypothetical protein
VVAVVISVILAVAFVFLFLFVFFLIRLLPHEYTWKFRPIRIV